MEYQRQARAGRVDQAQQQTARTLLQHAQRLLQPIAVINPYAPYLRIPEGVFKKLRTNWHYLRLIEIISLYHQHQREVKVSAEGKKYIETSLSDIEWANMLVKDSLLRKSDELSGAVRDFFERLKAEVAPTPGTFFAKDIRKAFRMHPQTLSRHLSLLSRMGYVRKICSWEDYEALKAGLNILDQTLEKLQTVSFTAASHSFTNQDVKLETVNSS